MSGRGNIGPARGALRRASSVLRRPLLIVLELAGIGLAGALAATVPQAPDDAAIRAFAARWPVAERIAAATGLHDVTTSPWFLVLVAVSLLSLLLVQLEQWGRVRRLWGDRLAPDALRRAPYRRAARTDACRKVPAAPRAWVTGRFGSLGSPIFHLGLVVVLAAGLWRALVVSDGSTRVVEGEVLEAGPDAWGVQRGGVASRPFALTVPVQVEAIAATWYPSGQLRQIEASLALGGGGVSPLAINAPLDLGRERLYLSSSWGLAAALVVERPETAEPHLVYLELDGDRAWGVLTLPDGRELRLKARAGPERAQALEVRLARGATLLALAELRPGERAALAPDEAVALVGLPYWAILRGSRDPTRGLFFTGLALALTGAVLMFVVVRVDAAVFVEGDELVVALRPHRFAPLFAERFDALCKEWIG